MIMHSIQARNSLNMLNQQHCHIKYFGVVIKSLAPYVDVGAYVMSMQLTNTHTLTHIRSHLFSAELCNAATRIQATFRGHLSRKLATEGGAALKDEQEVLQEITKKVAEELDIDMNDPELHKAATKIQASFRGHKARRDVD